MTTTKREDIFVDGIDADSEYYIKQIDESQNRLLVDIGDMVITVTGINAHRYNVGDSVKLSTFDGSVCVECKNNMFYDEGESLWYCPRCDI